MAKLFLLVALLATQGEADEEATKTTGVIKCVMESTFKSLSEWPLKFSGKLHQSAGPLQGQVEGNVWPGPPEPQRSLTLARDVGPLACTLESNADWPLKPTADFRATGSKEFADLGTIKYSVSSPVSVAWQGKKLTADMPSATVEWKKNIGGLDCRLKSDSVFSKQVAGDLEITKKVGDFECALRAPVQVDESGVLIEEPTAAIRRTDETPIGKVCGELKTSLESPDKVTGSLSLSKKLGLVCCNVEAKTDGKIKCTLQTSQAIETMKAIKKFTKIGEASEVSPSILSAPAVALIGMLVGSGLTFTVFSWFGPSKRALQAPLL